jgi:hypothetical protein
MFLTDEDEPIAKKLRTEVKQVRMKGGNGLSKMSDLAFGTTASKKILGPVEEDSASVAPSIIVQGTEKTEKIPLETANKKQPDDKRKLFQSTLTAFFAKKNLV